MDELNNNLSEPGSLDVKKLIHTLSDSLFFLGSANAGMVKFRCQLVKRELPMSMQGLCRDSIGFSGSHLFGDNLNASIKEVSELNKVSKTVQFAARGRITRRSSFRGRGFSSRAWRAGRGRYHAKRYQPWQSNRGNSRSSGNRKNPIVFPELGSI